MKSRIPEKVTLLEEVGGFIYGTLILFACIFLVVSSAVLICYFSSFLWKKDFFNPEFIQLCIYFVIGTFLLVFVYDERCKNKLKKPLNKTNH